MSVSVTPEYHRVLPLRTQGFTVRRSARQQLLSALPLQADYVQLLSYEATHVGYRCTALSRTADDSWFFVVVTWRLLLGRTHRIQRISPGTARALVSQQRRTGCNPRHADPLGGVITSSLRMT